MERLILLFECKYTVFLTIGKESMNSAIRLAESR